MGWLIADIGGTNTRCALASPAEGIRRIEAFRNRDFPSLEKLLASYLGTTPAGDRPDIALLAIAAPIRGEEIRMININWSFSTRGLARTLGLKRVVALNDFEALAYSLPALKPTELRQVGGGAAVVNATKVVLGPGTGLGAAGLLYLDGRWRAVTGEGGHASMPANDERESRIVAIGRERFGHCSAERVLSGSGLAFVHSALHGGAALDPAEVGRLIESGDAPALESLEVFFRFLGTVASDLALTYAAFGGVYIGGGITPRYLKQFQESGFRHRFEDKGRYRQYLAAIPTFAITAEFPTLTGLAAYGAGLPS